MGLYVVSPTPRHLEGLDLGLCGATILKNGEPEAFGAGIACMGHPLNALRFAAKERAELGSPLKAGDVVLVGGLTPAIPVQPKDHVVLNISGVGTTEMRFTDRNGKVQK
jgi:2-keto-4-pentenoate hydratase